jgi:DNA (cytosine-5)-methyltransferase 1
MTENTQHITLIELFSGIGAQVRGLRNTGLYDVEVIATSDIDKDTIVSYAAIHNGLTPEIIQEIADRDLPTEAYQKMADYLSSRNIGYDFTKNKLYDWQRLVNSKSKDLIKYSLACKLSHNLGDISKIKSLPYADLVTYSFPCTDCSIAGKTKGIIKGETRSGLLYEATRLFRQMVEDGNAPKYLLMENVKNLVGSKFRKIFDALLIFLDEIGYNTYWQVLNAAECSTPQNRERVFALSIRKDIDKGYEFPQPFDTGICLNDILEKDVDEKFFMREEQFDTLIARLTEECKLVDYPKPTGISANKGIIVNGEIS